MWDKSVEVVFEDLVELIFILNENFLDWMCGFETCGLLSLIIASLKN